MTPSHGLRLGVYGFTRVHLLHIVHMVYITSLPPSQPMGSRVYGITAVHWCTRNHNGFTGLHWFTLVTLFTPLHGLRLGVYGFTHVHLLHIVHMVYIIPPPPDGITGLHTLTSSTLFTWLTSNVSGGKCDVNLKDHFAFQYVPCHLAWLVAH